MTFYKCTLRAGHTGTGNSWDLTVYIAADSYTDAMKQARTFPAVKHSRSNCIKDIKIVDEKEYVMGSIVSGYSRRNSLVSESCLCKFEHIVKRLKCLISYKFQTKEGKTLKAFVDRYNQAFETDKLNIEQEYYNWAQGVVDENQLVR